jgi:hypothetical protein
MKPRAIDKWQPRPGPGSGRARRGAGGLVLLCFLLAMASVSGTGWTAEAGPGAPVPVSPARPSETGSARPSSGAGAQVQADHGEAVEGSQASVPPENRSLGRRYDAVVIRGEQIEPFLEAPISGLRLYAFQGGSFVAVPFQVDERDPEGEYVFPAGPKTSEDTDRGLFDYNDELVFLAGDTGDRAPEGPSGLPGLRGWAEIQLSDPLAVSQRSWVYLCGFAGEPPPLSDRDYVRYVPDSEQVFTDHYGLGYRKGMSLYSDLFYPDGRGGYGPDVLDRIKVRIKVKFLFNVIHVNKSEDDFRAEVVGWKDGPVRVLRNVQNYVRVLFKLSSASVFSVTEYYPWYMYTPLRMTIPFDLKWVFNKFGISDWYWYFYGDLPGFQGGTLYTNRNPQGIAITPDHPASWYREHVDLSHLLWGYATKEGLGTWFCNMVLPDCAYQFAKCYLNIDPAVSNPPEDVPGELGGGAFMNFKDVDSGLWQFMAPGIYTIGLETFFAPGGLRPEGVPEWTNIREFPIQADLERFRSPRYGPAAGGGKERPKPGPAAQGQVVIMTDLRGRQTRLCEARIHIGDMEATGWEYVIGQEIGTGKWWRIYFNEIKSMEQSLGPRDPVTLMEHPMVARITRRDGSFVSLMGCKSCVLSGSREDGRKEGYPCSGIARLEFLAPGEACRP